MIERFAARTLTALLHYFIKARSKNSSLQLVPSALASLAGVLDHRFASRPWPEYIYLNPFAWLGPTGLAVRVEIFNAV